MAGPMLKGLLEDRFNPRFHRENREMPVYALTVARGGQRICTPPEPMAMMSPPEPGRMQRNFCGVPGMRMKEQTFVFDLHAASMAERAGRFSANPDRVVSDKTGVAGIFDFHLEFVLSEARPGFAFVRGRTAPADNLQGAGENAYSTTCGVGLWPAGFFLSNPVARTIGVVRAPRYIIAECAGIERRGSCF
jgi:uncharacterized protein (TIGR03435 family)